MFGMRLFNTRSVRDSMRGAHMALTIDQKASICLHELWGGEGFLDDILSRAVIRGGR